MLVRKRNGETQEIDFEKIHWRVKSICSNKDILEFQKKERADAYKVFSKLPTLNVSKEDIDMITKKTIDGVYNGITTTEIDLLSAEIAQEMATSNPDNSVLATRLAISNMQKNILETLKKRFPETSTDEIKGNLFKYAMTALYYNRNQNGDLSPLVAPYMLGIAHKYSEKISSMIDPSRDFTNNTYLGIKTLEQGYLFKVYSMEGFKEKNIILETPGVAEMRVAIGLMCSPSPCVQAYPPGRVRSFISRNSDVLKEKAFGFDGKVKEEVWKDINTLKEPHKSKYVNTRLFKEKYWNHLANQHIKEAHVTDEQWGRIWDIYDGMSRGLFTPATPTRFSVGSLKPQGSSCFLLAMKDDSLEGIYDTLSDQSEISKHSGGVGIWCTNIRGCDSYIAGTNGKSNGLKLMLKVFDASSCYVNQSGKRPGSIAIYVEPWHTDIMDFVQMKRKKGAETDRARNLFYALWIPDEFLRCWEANKDWYLFDPVVTPKLYNCYDEEFSSDYLTDEFLLQPGNKQKFLFTYRYRKYIRQGKYTKKIPIEKIMEEVVETAADSGGPYMLAKDACNRKSNQKNIDVIKSSNLCTEIIQRSDGENTAVCLTGDTEILTTKGVKRITECDGEYVLSYFNNDIDLKEDQHFEKATLINNGVKDVYQITAFSSKPIKATKDHKFLVRKSIKYTKGGKVLTHEWKKVEELKVGDYLLTPKLNPFPGYDIDINDYDLEYLTAGWMMGDGWMTKSSYGACFSPKEQYAADIVLPQLNKWQQSFDALPCGHNKIVKTYTQPNGVVNWHSSKTKFKEFLNEKFGFKVAKGPTKTISEKIKTATPKQLASFLSGLFSADGCVMFEKRVLCNLSSASEELLHDVQHCLKLFGIHSTVRFAEIKGRNRSQGCLDIRQKINLERFQKSINFTLVPEKREKLKRLLSEEKWKVDLNKDYKQIRSIEYVGKEEVYDLNLPSSHNFLANGTVVHNCNLSSVCLNKFVRRFQEGDKIEFKYNVSLKEGEEDFWTFDFEELGRVVKIAHRNIDRLIDINYYPTEKALRSNFSTRDCGIGVQGEADVFTKLKLAWNSREAKRLRFYIYERMYYEALKSSCELSKLNGPYEYFKGSPASRGLLQFDLWQKEGKKISFDLSLNWDGLKQDIMTYGLRNSLLIAMMPTASTAQIMGNSPAIEPLNSLVYVRRSNTGDVAIFNKDLIGDLDSLGMWNKEMRDRIIANHGSIKDFLDIPKKLRDAYLTVFDLEPEDIVDAAYVRGWFTDQSQSMNLFIRNVTMSSLSKAWTRGWKRGLKTLSYYIHTRTATTSQKAQISVKDVKKEGSAVEGKREGSRGKEENKGKEEERKEKVGTEGPVCSRDNPDCLSCGS